jgi:hypothetical protein
MRGQLETADRAVSGVKGPTATGSGLGRHRSGPDRRRVVLEASPDTLPPVGVVRTLFASALVGAAGSARAGVGVARLTLTRTPSLLTLSARAVAPGSGGARADAEFRDELLTLLDDVAEVAWRQARRARLELGDRTSPSDRTGPGDRTGPTNGGVPVRRHRVKT